VPPHKQRKECTLIWDSTSTDNSGKISSCWCCRWWRWWWWKWRYCNGQNVTVSPGVQGCAK